MPAITTLIALVGVASSISSVLSAKDAAKKQLALAKKQADEAKAALQAKRPSDDTAAKFALAERDEKLKRGKGPRAKQIRQAQAGDVGGLTGQSASDVGGLGTA